MGVHFHSCVASTDCQVIKPQRLFEGPALIVRILAYFLWDTGQKGKPSIIDRRQVDRNRRGIEIFSNNIISIRSGNIMQIDGDDSIRRITP